MIVNHVSRSADHTTGSTFCLVYRYNNEPIIRAAPEIDHQLGLPSHKEADVVPHRHVGSNMGTARTLFVTLIRTHHVTSRKKLQRVKKAATHFGVPFVLVRYGGSPGLMYAESGESSSLGAWVSAVKDLRYKDFQCVYKPEARQLNDGSATSMPSGAFNETESVSSFSEVMDRKGLAEWFKIGLLSKRAGQFDGDG